MSAPVASSTAAKRVPDRRPAGRGERDRTGGVRRDELQVDLLTGVRGVAPVRVTGVDDDRASTACAAASTRMLRKPGPAISTDSTPSTAASRSCSVAASPAAGRRRAWRVATRCSSRSRRARAPSAVRRSPWSAARPRPARSHRRAPRRAGRRRSTRTAPRGSPVKGIDGLERLFRDAGDGDER